MTRFSKARALALLTPAALLAGAYASELWGGLYPCEMCWWQRYAHFVALGVALLSLWAGRTPAARPLVAVAAVCIAVAGGFGAYHAGVEYGWWEGVTTCSTMSAGGSHADILADILATPLVRCDQAQWTLWGVSLAGWNALVSLGAAGLILWLTRKA